MKKTLLNLTLIFSSAFAFSQHCNLASGSYICNDVSQSNPGFEDINNLPCIVQGQAVDFIIKFKTPPQWPNPQATVNSFQLASMVNLPCGLCWTTNKNGDNFLAEESGCIRITGTTNDPVGLYKAQIIANANIGNNQQVNGVQIATYDNVLPGFKLYLRVKATANDACPTLDLNSQGLPANTGCPLTDPVSVNDLDDNFTNVSLYPNPAQNEAIFSFSSVKADLYNVSVTDATGKVVFSDAVSVLSGSNNIRISTESLTNGLYFVNVSNGNSTVNGKVMVSH